MSNGDTGAYQTALARAQALAAKLKKNTEQPPATTNPGLKRAASFETDTEVPPFKKSEMDMDNGNSLTEQVAVPDKMVGMIIGRGGEQITRLQQESGCKIQMASDSGGQPVRMCTLTGSPEAISQAKVLIDGVIANSPGGADAAQGARGGGGGGPPGGMGDFGGMGGGQTVEIMVPGNKVGLVIGKGGETIKNLQMQTGAKITVIQENNSMANEKPLRISGTPQVVEIAKVKVMELLQQLDGGPNGAGRGRGGPMGGMGGGRGPQAGWPSGGGGGMNGGDAVDYVGVSQDKIGLVIGKGGDTIKSINQASGAFVEIDKKAPQDAPEKNFIIRGSKENVERAKQMVLEKIGATPGSGYGAFPGQTFIQGGGGQANGGGAPGGFGGGAPGGGAPGGAPGGAADYSAQWIEYYRSQGMFKEAEEIERQQAAQAAAANQAAAVAASQQQQAAAAAGGQADYSAQWADYYRSIGKMKEAEAIEAQMRAKMGGAPAAPAGYPGGAPQQPGYPAASGYYPGY